MDEEIFQNLVKLDHNLGIIAFDISLSRFNEHYDSFNIQDFTICMRQKKSLLDSFVGLYYDLDNVKLCKTGIQESIIFENRIQNKDYKDRTIIDNSIKKSDNSIKTNKIPELVFIPLKNKEYFTFSKYDKNSKCYFVERNLKIKEVSKKIMKESSKLLEIIQVPPDYKIINESIIKDEKFVGTLKNRLLMTSHLAKSFVFSDIVESILLANKQKINEFLKDYHNKMNFLLLGTVGKSDKDSILFMLSYFDCDVCSSGIKNTFVNLDSFLDEFIKKNTCLKKTLKKIRNHCHIFKIVAKSKNSSKNGFYVIFFFTFHDDIAQTFDSLKIKKIYDYLEKQLQWNVYRSKNKEVLTIPLV